MKNVLIVAWKVLPTNSGDALNTFGFIKNLSTVSKVFLISYFQGEKEIIENSKQHQELQQYCEEIEFIQHGNASLDNNFRNKNIAFKVKDFLHRNFLLYRIVAALKNSPYRWYYNQFFLKKICEYINRHKIEIIVFDQLSMTCFFEDIYNSYTNKLQFIVNEHNAEYLNAMEMFKSNEFYKDKIINYVLYLRIKNHEREIIEKADRVLAVSKEDAYQIKKLTKKSVAIIVNKPVVFFEKVKKEVDFESFNKKLLIVGSLWWYPNVHGVVWFIDNVYKKILDKDPEYKLYIVGKEPAESIYNSAKKFAEKIVITGEVKDTADYYKKCDISIVPLFQGSGVKIKVLESLGRGIPTIVTSLCAKDFELKDSAIICDTPDEFVEAVLTVERKAELRKELYKNSTEFYNKYMEFDLLVKDVFT